MSKKIKYWCTLDSSGQPPLEGECTLEEIFLKEKDWNKFSEWERAGIVRNIIMNRLEWGFETLDDNEASEAVKK